MTPQDLIELAIARHGKNWKMAMAQETGWSYWTFHRIASGTYPVSPKLEDKIRSLKPKRGATP